MLLLCFFRMSDFPIKTAIQYFHFACENANKNHQAKQLHWSDGAAALQHFTNSLAISLNYFRFIFFCCIRLITGALLMHLCAGLSELCKIVYLALFPPQFVMWTNLTETPEHRRKWKKVYRSLPWIDINWKFKFSF
jgi:hypothetical protein